MARYSKSEKKAYHMGRGWAAGKAGKKVAVKGTSNKRSFSNGVKSANRILKAKKVGN